MKETHSLFSSSPLSGISLFHLSFPYSSSIHKQTGPIGKRMESSFEHAISHHEEWDLIAQGAQVQGENRTLGEFDFLLKDSSGSVTHVELVTKFYVYLPWVGSSPMDHCIGPRFKDRLSFKLHHLISHQFPLLYRPESNAILQEKGIHDVTMVSQRLCFCAEIYLPYGWQKELPHPLNPRCVRGTWMFFSEFAAYPDDAGFHVCTKGEWLGEESLGVDWVDKSESIEQIHAEHSQGNSPMIWKQEQGTIKRMFILPDAFARQQ